MRVTSQSLLLCLGTRCGLAARSRRLSDKPRTHYVMWSLVFAALHVLGAWAGIDCDKVDEKCRHSSCISLKNGFTTTCALAVIQLTCPNDCEKNYEALLAYTSQTEPNLGHQYAVCTCRMQAGPHFCDIRRTITQKCNVSSPGGLSTPSTGTTNGTGYSTTTTAFQLSCDTSREECLRSRSCGLFVDNVMKECFRNETDTITNVTCTSQCRVAILTGRTDTKWNKVETCSSQMCLAHDSACQSVLPVRRVISACDKTVPTTEIPNGRHGTNTGMNEYTIDHLVILSLLMYNIASYL